MHELVDQLDDIVHDLLGRDLEIRGHEITYSVQTARSVDATENDLGSVRKGQWLAAVGLLMVRAGNDQLTADTAETRVKPHGGNCGRHVNAARH
ncbi:hypothetical protein O7611_01260 [Micromonospora sp. WMMC273]|nr:hypothetical protein [Micromonospora sp. WMMC273]MCZ7473003.1 hypothetical protein [Micromonospora sp. WMMC273]